MASLVACPSSTVDSLDLTDSDTRLTHAVQQVQSLKEDVQGVLLVTDGIHKSTIERKKRN